MRRFSTQLALVATVSISALVLASCAVVPPPALQTAQSTPTISSSSTAIPSPVVESSASEWPVTSNNSSLAPSPEPAPSPSLSQLPSPSPSPSPSPTLTLSGNTTPASPDALVNTAVLVDTRKGAELDKPFEVNGIPVFSKTHRVSKKFVPAKLTKRGLTPEADKAALELIAAAKKDGVTIKIRSAYRSYETQDSVYKRALQTYPSKAEAKRFNAAPGESEHQSGLSIDFWNGRLRGQGIANTPLGKWLWKHAREYGFILRYPDGKEEITGYTFEPWHYRYIGVEDSMKFKPNSNMTLEEYLGID